MPKRVDDLVAALEPPEFVYRGKVYQGRLISFGEAARLAPKFDGLKEIAHTDPAKMLPVLREYLDLIFPRPPWQFWRRRVSSMILEMPPQIVWDLIADFFASAARRAPAAPDGNGGMERSRFTSHSPTSSDTTPEGQRSSDT